MDGGKHTYVRRAADRYVIGRLQKIRPDGVETFVPMFDVGSRTDAVVAVNTLNGGDPSQSVGIIKEHAVPEATPKTG
jgi:hypothetical protein